MNRNKPSDKKNMFYFINACPLPKVPPKVRLSKLA